MNSLIKWIWSANWVTKYLYEMQNFIMVSKYSFYRSSFCYLSSTVDSVDTCIFTYWWKSVWISSIQGYARRFLQPDITSLLTFFQIKFYVCIFYLFIYCEYHSLILNVQRISVYNLVVCVAISVQYLNLSYIKQLFSFVDKDTKILHISIKRTDTLIN
jgi:hypothetical protein